MQRQNRMEGTSRPTQITIPVTKQLSAIHEGRSSSTLSNDGIPLVLNDYRLREDFSFDTPEFQVLYDLLRLV